MKYRVGAVVGPQPPLEYTSALGDIHNIRAVVGPQPPLEYTRQVFWNQATLAVVGPQPPLEYTTLTWNGTADQLWLAHNRRSNTLRAVFIPANLRCGWPTTAARIH